MRSLRAFRLLPVPLLTIVMVTGLGSAHAFAADPCTPPVTNAVACENTKPGDAPSDWQVNGIGDSTIQGFATQMSVNVGQTVNFKIKTPASSYHIDILRLGYYGGDGARLIQSNIKPSATLPQTQPNCTTTSSTGPGRMRQLGGLGLMDGALDGGLGPLHRPSGAKRHRRREPDLLRRPRRLEPLRPRPQDRRHDLAGVQRLRRQQPLLVHGGLPARRTGGIQGGLRGLLQPAL